MNTEHKSDTPKEIRDLWQTPRALFDRLDREFNFKCDVAASEDNKLCDVFIDEKTNALIVDYPWYESNWCNPPYSKNMPWVNKACIEHQKGRTIVMLVPADTSTQWFKEAYRNCNEVRFISGRLSFINARTKKPVDGNNKGSVLFIWRAYCESHCVSLVDRSDYE